MKTIKEIKEIEYKVFDEKEALDSIKDVSKFSKDLIEHDEGYERIREFTSWLYENSFVLARIQ